MPADVEVLPVQLPGREERLAEAAIPRLRELVDTLEDVLYPWLMDAPFAFFGHSMGALIGFELTRRLRDVHAAQPVHLYASAHRAPHLPDPGPFFHQQSDAALVGELRRLSGTRREVLDNAELVQLFLPTFRADLTVCETYGYVSSAPLRCPISVYGGMSDTEASVVELAGWREHTSSTFRMRTFPGDHFYLASAQERFLGAFSADLAAHILAPMEVGV